VVYISRWERLSDAVTRVMEATGLSKEKARISLCQAIADGAVKIRAKPNQHTTRLSRSHAVLDGEEFQIPTQLESEDLDWDESRPLKPWLVQRGKTKIPPGYWELKWIELCTTDVTEVLCAAGQQGESAQRASMEKAATRRRRPTFERARAALKKLYPQGVPEQAAEPNAILCRRVGDILKKEGLRDASDDTILRAAGRRK
jgi:hypothetical protein